MSSQCLLALGLSAPNKAGARCCIHERGEAALAGARLAAAVLSGDLPQAGNYRLASGGADEG